MWFSSTLGLRQYLSLEKLSIACFSQIWLKIIGLKAVTSRPISTARNVVTICMWHSTEENQTTTSHWLFGNWSNFFLHVYWDIYQVSVHGCSLFPSINSSYVTNSRTQQCLCHHLSAKSNPQWFFSAKPLPSSTLHILSITYFCISITLLLQSNHNNILSARGIWRIFLAESNLQNFFVAFTDPLYASKLEALD